MTIEIAERAPGTEVTTAVTRSSSFNGASAGIREYVAGHGIDVIARDRRGIHMDLRPN